MLTTSSFDAGNHADPVAAPSTLSPEFRKIGDPSMGYGWHDPLQRVRPNSSAQLAVPVHQGAHFLFCMGARCLRSQCRASNCSHCRHSSTSMCFSTRHHVWSVERTFRKNEEHLEPGLGVCTTQLHDSMTQMIADMATSKKMFALFLLSCIRTSEWLSHGGRNFTMPIAPRR